LASPEIVRWLNTVPETASGGGNIIIFEAAVVYPPQRAGWRDIHDRTAELAKNPRRAQALARARQKLAQELSAPALAVLRLQKGWSQTELAQRIGTSQSRLSLIESGIDDPLHRTVVKLAEALGEELETVSRALLENGKKRRSS
jgi:DNA-binding XRE family transcriptional regulator